MSAVTTWVRRLASRRSDAASARRQRDVAQRRLEASTRNLRKRLALARGARHIVMRLRRQAAAGSSRGRALAWCREHTGVTESPPGSNTGPGITDWQLSLGSWLVGQPWCGVYCAAALRAAGVQGVTSRMAAVAFIEDDARAGRVPFRKWTTNPDDALPGDLAVLFGRGVHVAVVESIDVRAGIVRTREGNTSSGTAGSQSNGGGAFARVRPLSSVHGFACVNYPG